VGADAVPVSGQTVLSALLHPPDGAAASRHASRRMVEIGLPDARLLPRVTPDAVTRLALVPDLPVLALIKSTSIEVYREQPLSRCGLASIRSQRSVSRTATTMRRVNRILQTKSDVSHFTDARY
jgi:hypothetical protein